MTTQVRVSVASGQPHGVRIKNGTHVIEVPPGGQQVFHVWQTQRVVIEEGSDPLPDVTQPPGDDEDAGRE